jgi:hypothetical protein
MTGFLSDYDGDEKIDIITPSGAAYWVTVKRCLSEAEMARVETALGAAKRRVVMRSATDSDEIADLDYREWREEMVCRSITGWNLTDQNGGDLPLSPENLRRASVHRLPSPVFDRIWARCNELNKPEEDPQERVRFPEPPVGGDPVGDGRAAGPEPLPA